MKLFRHVPDLLGSLGRAAQAAVTPGAEVLAPPSYVNERRAICEACPQRAGLRCSICTCVIVAKTRLAQESCPIKKW